MTSSSDLVLIVGGPFNGQTTHIDLHGSHGPLWVIEVPDHPEPIKLSEWSNPDDPTPLGRLASRLTSTYYTLRGRQAIERFFPSWRAFTGELLVALMVAPSVRERGLQWRTMPKPVAPLDPPRSVRDVELRDRYTADLNRWEHRREAEERMFTDRLWRSHMEFRCVSEVDREDLEGAGNPGFIYGEATVSFRWLADLTPAQLEVEAEEKREEIARKIAAREEPK